MSAILVTYIGAALPAPHRSADGVGIYAFAGRVPVRVEQPADVAKFRVKAQKNPADWKVDEAGVGARVAAALTRRDGPLTTENAPRPVKRTPEA